MLGGQLVEVVVADPELVCVITEPTHIGVPLKVEVELSTTPPLNNLTFIEGRFVGLPGIFSCGSYTVIIRAAGAGGLWQLPHP